MAFFLFQSGTNRPRYLRSSQAMSTRYTNAVVNKTFDPPHTFKNEDGSEGVAVPPHVRHPLSISRLPYRTLSNKSQFAGLEKDEVIPREWLAKMDKWQHELESSIHWDQGDVLIVDVSTHTCSLSL